jgi:hypothetical protein
MFIALYRSHREELPKLKSPELPRFRFLLRVRVRPIWDSLHLHSLLSRITTASVLIVMFVFQRALFSCGKDWSGTIHSARLPNRMLDRLLSPAS